MVKIKEYLRTYPRSGTHLLSSFLHFYYGFTLPGKGSSYTTPIIGEGEFQLFTTHDNDPKYENYLIGIYQLRNPLDCIASQFYRFGPTEREQVPNEKRDQYLNTLPKNSIPKTFQSPPLYNSLWNEVGKYNHIINSINPWDCVLYYEDLFNNTEEYFNTLDSYLKRKYNLTKLTPKKSFEEILDFTAEYYSKSQDMLSRDLKHHQTDFPILKEKWKPTILKFLDNNNPYIQRYVSYSN